MLARPQGWVEEQADRAAGHVRQHQGGDAQALGQGEGGDGEEDSFQGSRHRRQDRPQDGAHHQDREDGGKGARLWKPMKGEIAPQGSS
ncbi:hypothetical protein [Xanthobacter autotrophicus]|uniref:hypothetical protein n=1 Tax=Xanthobacter autotrophicus TaxID=280 RepID=UPI00372BC23E